MRLCITTDTALQDIHKYFPEIFYLRDGSLWRASLWKEECKITEVDLDSEIPVSMSTNYSRKCANVLVLTDKHLYHIYCVTKSCNSRRKDFSSKHRLYGPSIKKYTRYPVSRMGDVAVYPRFFYPPQSKHIAGEGSLRVSYNRTNVAISSFKEQEVVILLCNSETFGLPVCFSDCGAVKILCHLGEGVEDVVYAVRTASGTCKVGMNLLGGGAMTLDVCSKTLNIIKETYEHKLRAPKSFETEITMGNIFKLHLTQGRLRAASEVPSRAKSAGK